MEKIFLEHPWIIMLILLWSLPWKVVALWRSARRGHLGWFLTMTILNTLAILDIIYIFFFSGPLNAPKEETEEKIVRQSQQKFRPRTEQESDELQNIQNSQRPKTRVTIV